MAGRQRQPIKLVMEKGKKHLTKQEIEEREKTEIVVAYKDVKPPTYLSQKQKKEFVELADKLVGIGIMTELDEDCLARYLISRDNYIRFTKLLNKSFREANSKKNIDKLPKIEEKIESYLIQQDRAFKQCRASASDLGLSISSRCRLIMPSQPEQPKENKFSKFKAV